MKSFKILSLALCLVLIFSSISVMAISFDDVDNDPTVSWAKASIDKMTNSGYIKGYEDGTFRPFRPISKIECLILMSRMLGLENSEFSGLVSSAQEAYQATATKYNTTYAKELSYLLYCNILEEKDLTDYASTANANTQLLRYQAAILMSKLMGENDEAKAFTVTAPTYADDASIPASAKPYVEYVTKSGIMNGMDSTADGRPQFSPTTSLTRAQMATLLARMMDKLDLQYISGKVEGIEDGYVTVDGEEYELAKDAGVYMSGGIAEAGDISAEDEVSMVVIKNKAILIEADKPQKVTTVYGIVVNKNENSSGKKITIADYEDKNISETYTLSDSCKITKGSSKATFGEIMADDFVKLVITGSRVTSLSTENTKLDIVGKLESIDYDDDDHVYLNVTDKDGSNLQTFTASIKGVKISRDGDTAEFRDLTAGDNVELRLTYGKVTVITATSISERFSGLLSEIIISSKPAVTITTNNTSKTYKLRPDVKITVAGAAGTIYDLRPNITVSGVLDSNEVKSLTAATVAVSEKGEMTGTVVGKNTSYSVITIRDEDGNTQSVYYNARTTFLNSNGQSATARSIENGATISVTGSDKNGIFEATIVIVK